MQNRISTYPGRVKLTPVAGQADIYDMERADEPIQPGTPLNKSTLLSDTTAEMLGLPSTATVNDAFNAVYNSTWRKIQEYTVAGAYTWTAPDLNQGQPYTIGVWMCGGGGSGGLGTYNWKTSGGASGYDANVITQVTPGQTYNLVVGAGGAAITSTNNIAGNNGGSTSAFNKTAAGGNGGGASSDSTASAIGGQPAAIGLLEKNSMYGGLTIEFATGKYAVPGSSCYNQFTGERKLGAGGGIYSSSSSAYVTGVGGKGPHGLGGGDAVFGNGATAGDATEYGCGGGAVARSNVQSATNGAGADGAIFIYYGGAEE